MRKTVLLTIGIPGSGKSTYAAEYVSHGKGSAVFLNADNAREELYGDPKIQGDPLKVFGLLRSRFLTAMKDPSVQYIAIDNTNLSTKIRKQWYDLVKDRSSVDWVLVYFPVNVEKAKRQNKMRDRFVPEDVIDRMAGRLTPPTAEEKKFAEIIEVR